MTTDTSERGLEELIVRDMTLKAGGWLPGSPESYEQEYGVDLAQLRAFLEETQPQTAAALELAGDGTERRKFLARLQGAIAKDGVVAILRRGLKHGPHEIDLFYGTPSP